MTNAAVELVVAVSENDVIGRANQLPWRLPADLRHFKSLTMGHHILMGRKTYESIGKALPGRTNWVLSRADDFAPADCQVARSLQEAQFGASDAGPLMVIGGAEIYRAALAKAQRIELTEVHRPFEGDAVFSFEREAWREVARQEHVTPDGLSFSYVTLTRK